jgi:hypothetical protein
MSATARARSVKSMVVADMCPHRVNARIPESQIPSREALNYRLGLHPEENIRCQAIHPRESLVVNLVR